MKPTVLIYLALGLIASSVRGDGTTCVVPSDDGGSLTTCDLGSQLDEGGSCVECPAGKYGPTGESCLDCAAGKFTLAAGMSACTECEDGHSGSAEGVCTICAAGTAGGGSLGTCSPCGRYGSWSAAAGQSDCSYCPAGTRVGAFVAPSIEAVIASSNTCLSDGSCVGYDPATDQSGTCIACEAGSAPASGITDMDYGYYWDGAWATTTRGGEICQSCSGDEWNPLFGWTSEDGAAYCSTCPSSAFLSEYRGDSTEAYCSTDCDADFAAGTTFSPLYAYCVPINAPVDPDFVATCGAGEKYDADASACVSCGRNSYALPGAAACTRCAEGYVPNEAGTGCVDKSHSACGEGEVAARAIGNYDCAMNYALYGAPDGGNAAWMGGDCLSFANMWLWNLPTNALNMFEYLGMSRFCANLDTSLLLVGYPPASESQNAAIADITAAQPTWAARWGQDDSDGLNNLLFPGGMTQYTSWPSIIAPAEFGFIELQGLIDSKISYEYAYNAGYYAGRPNEVGDDGYPDQLYPIDCADSGFDREFNRQTGRHDALCKSTIFAMYCPATCGIVPDPKSYCGAAQVPHRTTPGAELIASFFTAQPIVPEELKDCAVRTGIWNHATGLLEPACDPSGGCPAGTSAVSETCEPDSANWFKDKPQSKTNDDLRDCAWVAKKTSTRCGQSHRKFKAREACLHSCAPGGLGGDGLVDSPTWYSKKAWKRKGSVEGCDMVSTFKKACDEQGRDKASDACGCSCHDDVIAPEYGTQAYCRA